MAMQHTVPPTPQQALQAARLLLRIGYAQVLVMPWVMFLAFMVPGANLCTLANTQPYVTCEPFMNYTLALAMVWMLIGGVAVIAIAKEKEAKALAQLPSESQNPVVRF